MGTNPSKLISFGEVLIARDPSERLTEEVYQGIPALAALSSSALAAGNKLGQDARNALFYGAENDPGLRQLKVQLAVERLETMQTSQPDLEWLRGAPRMGKAGYQSSALYEDEWLKPESP